MPKGFRVPVAALAALFMLMTLSAPGSVSALQIGDKAPDFLLFSTIGEALRLSSFQGQKHVLLFFFVRAFGGV
jgi:hypothetical protein